MHFAMVNGAASHRVNFGNNGNRLRRNYSDGGVPAVAEHRLPACAVGRLPSLPDSVASLTKR